MNDALLKRLQSLSPENRKTLELYLKNKGKEDISILSSTILKEESGSYPERCYPEGYYPLSSAQKRLYLISQIDELNITYNISLILIMEGNLDQDRFAKSCRELILRHESLRTSFELIDGEPVQKIHREIDFEMSYFESEEPKVANIIRNFIQPFDLSKAPLFRIGLVKLREDNSLTRHIFVIDIHHIISDGISTKIIIKELLNIYYGQALPELKKQYKDFAAWQNALMGNLDQPSQDKALCTKNLENYKKQEEYWLNLFSGDIPVLNLPTDFVRPPQQSFEGDIIDFQLEGEIVSKLNKLASENGASLFMGLFAVLNILFFRYSGQNDIIVGAPIAGRRNEDFDNTVGLFVNTLAFRNHPEGGKTFQEFLREVRESLLKSYENQDYQFETLVEKLNLRRDLSRNPLFDVMFNLQNINWEEINAPGLKIKDYGFGNPVAKFDLSFEIFKSEKTLHFHLEYCTRLFKKETIERLKGHFINILNVVVKQPEIKISAIDIMSEEEKHRILFEFNNTKADYPREKTVQQLFEEQVERTPDNIALCAQVRGGESQLTYRQLNNRANQVAVSLRAKGIKPDNITGIMVERAPEMIAGILGILKAGGAYLPIDPEYPEERIKYMLEDSKASLLLTQKGIGDKGDYKCNKVYLEDEEIYSGDESNLKNINKPGDLAYVIYTSGSTGKPKGVMIEHRTVNNFIKGVTARIEFQPPKSILTLTTVSFDIFVLETLLPLTKGMKIILADEETQKDPKAINTLLIRHKIEMLQATPSRMQILMREENFVVSLETLKEIMIGGEALPQSLLDNLTGLKGCKIYNMYGPTETTVWSAIKDLTGSSVAYIGEPIANTQLYILDKYHNIQPLGVAGQIYISGDGLARGYLNRPDLTAEKFVPNPFYNSQCTMYNEQHTLGEYPEPEKFHPSESAPSPFTLQTSRMYRTGDLARLLPDGSIEFLGRVDYQVKIRGFRIELGEIENALLKHEAVKEAVVIDKVDKDGNKYLCSYILIRDRHACPPQDISLSQLRDHLSKELPEYMIPSYFVRLEEMPLTPNGKIDRKALPEPDGNIKTGTEYEAPANEIEAKLVSIWQEILNREQVGVNDNFFEIGGHSLKATKLIANISKTFHVDVPLKEIFKLQTVKGLAKYIDNAEVSEFFNIKPVERREYYPVSSAQKRFYLLSLMENIGVSYNMPSVMVVEGRLDVERFKNTLKMLVKRHESLRTSFELVDEEPVQRVYEDVELNIGYLESGEDTVNDVIRDLIRPFDLSKSPLLRVWLVKISELKHILVFDIHHIIADGVSMEILKREFMSLYSGVILPELRIQYKDFSEWQSEVLKSDAMKKQEDYWMKILDGSLPVLKMPFDYARPDNMSFEGKTTRFTIQAGDVAKLETLAKEHGATLNTLLFSVYTILLYKYTGQDDLIIGSLVAGRRHPNLENLIGLFINFLPIRNKVDGDSTFSRFLNNAKERILSAYENQDYPFDKMIEKFNIKVAPSRNPIFDTMLIFHNEMDPNIQVNIDGVSFLQYDLELNVTKLDFKLDIYPGNNGEYDCFLQYNTRLFKKETIQDLIRHFNMLLDYILSAPVSKTGKLSEINVFTEEERHSIIDRRKPQDKTSVNLAVAATFTAEPIEDFIKWWGKQFGINISVKFAAYNQVFQELLDNNSIISVNDGLNLLLVRFEDWVRNSRVDEESNIKLLERNFSELIEALEKKAKKAPYIVGIFPVATHLALGESIMNYIEGMNTRWKMQLEKNENIYIADFTALPGMYNIQEIFDPFKDKTGHLPFSDEYYAAMGSMIARKIYAYKNQTFKVIVLDCDNTLWQGVCGEDGPLGVTVDETFTALQKFMLERNKEGMLLTLCSKNNESDVWEVFEKNPGMLLKKEHFAGWRINWRPKSGNIKELARELNLGVDSFIFIDDSEVECAEIMTNCPDVLTLQLPGNKSQIPAFLKHVWAFDRFKVTAEDRKRSGMYIAEKKRKEMQDQGLMLLDFLKGLEIKLSMKEMESSQLTRIAQLTQRTNQFNLSAIRRTETEVTKLVSEPGVICWTVEASDRFGDYGLVGVLVTKKHEKHIFIDTFLLSCRVLGRRIEDAIITLLKKYCHENSIDMLYADYYPTEKNKHIQEFLERTGWKAVDVDGAYTRRNYTSYNICTKEIPDFIEYIDCYYKTSYEKTDKEESVFEVSQFLNDSAATELETSSAKDESNEWEVSIINEANLRHVNHLTPLKYYTAKMLLKLPLNEADLQVNTGSEYLPPTNETEEKLIGIWQKVLVIDKIGINDNFFRLGGHSLKAARLVSIILKTFKVEVPLSDIFKLQTVKEMAKYINDKQAEYRTGVNREAPLSDLAREHGIVTGAVPLLPNRFILEIRKHDINHWNLCEMVELYPMPEIDKIKTIARYILNYHDGLRLRLYRGESGWEQVIVSPEEELPVTCIDLSDIPEHLQKDAIEKKADEFQRCIRLADKPVYFIAYYLGPGKPGRLQIIVHHALADGYSFTLLLQDLFTAFMQFMNSGKIQLPPKTTSIKRWAEYLNEFAQTEELRDEIDYWLSIPGELNRIPVDYPEGLKYNIFKSERFIYSNLLTKEEAKRLSGSINAKNIQMTEIALAALVMCIYKWTGTASLLVDYTMNGRYPLHKDIDLSGTVGWLAFLIPIYVDISRATNNLEILEIVSRRIRNIPRGGFGYGCLRYLSKDKEISDRMKKIPMPEITFNYINFDFSSDASDMQPLQAGNIKIASESVGEKEGENINRGRLLDLVIGGDQNGLFSKWHYSMNVHKAETVDKISKLYRDELLSLIKCL